MQFLEDGVQTVSFTPLYLGEQYRDILFYALTSAGPRERVSTFPKGPSRCLKHHKKHKLKMARNLMLACDVLTMLLTLRTATSS